MRFFAPILIAFPLLLPCGEVAAQGPLLIREVVSREVGINVGAYSEPEIKEVVSREVGLFIGAEPEPPYKQVVSREVSLVMADAAAPPQVTQFTVTASPSGSTVTLDWSSYNPWQVRDVAYYEVYYSPSGPFSDVSSMTPLRIVPGETLSTVFNGLEEWQDHYFAVVAVDGLGNRNTTVQYRAAYVLTREVVSREVGLFIGAEPEPPFKQVISREVSLVMADAMPPPLVTQVNMTISPAGDTVTLDWSSYNPWQVRDVAHYAVFYSAIGPISDVSGMTPLRIVPGETLTTTFTGLTLWQDHFFAVVAVDGLGHAHTVVPTHGAYVLMPEVVSREVGLFIGAEPEPPHRQVVSREISVVVGSEAVPAPVTVQGGGFQAISSRTAFGAADLDWTHYNEWEQRDVVRYRIYVSTSFFDDVTGMTPHAISADGRQTATITGFSNEEIIYVAVVAEDALGQFNPAVYARSTKTSVNVLGDVSNLAATPAPTSIAYTWDLGGIGTDLGYFVREFRVYVNGSTMPVILAPDQRSWTATGLPPETAHSIRVTTVDIHGLESTGATIQSATTVWPIGSVDPAFAANVNGRVTCMAKTLDGNLVIGGDFTMVNGVTRNRLARLFPDGTLDTSYHPNVNGTVWCLVAANQNRLLIGGAFTAVGGVTRNRTAFLEPDGFLHSIHLSANNTVRSMTVQRDGRVLAGGDFTQIASATRNRLARFNADLTLETAFNPNVNDIVRTISVMPDEKIMVGGSFTSVSGQQRLRLARLNADGTLDAGFTMNASDVVFATLPLWEGGLLVCGTFSTLGGAPRPWIARLHTDGSLDEAFQPGCDSLIYSAVQQMDGKILLGGQFTQLGGQAVSRLGRLNPDGSLDTTFSASASDIVFALMLDDAGRIWAGGDFTLVNGVASARMARLLNHPATQRLAVLSASSLKWDLGGSFPATVDARFFLENGEDVWDPLSEAVKQPNGWELSGLNLPPSGRVLARVRSLGGIYSTSSSIHWVIQDYTLDTPLRLWKQQHLGDADAPDDGDSDGDGLLDLAEYALVTDPVSANNDHLRQALSYDGTHDRWRLVLQRDPARSDVMIEVQATSTLMEPWTTLATSLYGGAYAGPGYVSGEDGTPGIKTVEIRDVINADSAQRRFYRVRVHR